MKLNKYSFIVLITILLGACGSPDNGRDSDAIDESLPLQEQIDLLIEMNEYETALTRLSGRDRTDPEIARLLEKTHLNYALHSMTTFDETKMRTRMNNALLHFTEVLRINPNNIVAREQIEQILSIYKTFPNREPDPEVMEGLREFGF